MVAVGLQLEVLLLRRVGALLLSGARAGVQLLEGGDGLRRRVEGLAERLDLLEGLDGALLAMHN